MKEQLESLFSRAIDQLKSDGILENEQEVRLQFDRTRQKEHGDFATNVAMTLAKRAGLNPRDLAAKFIQALPEDSLIDKLEIAGPGFINIFLASDARHALLETIFAETSDYGLSPANSKSKILVEFVSANPTGPLHVGHGRGAAYGDALARVLRAAGNTVESEYYVNDAGRQMDILATSVWLRYLQEFEAAIEFPDNCYKGQYIIDMAKDVVEHHKEKYIVDADLIEQARKGLEDEAGLDALIVLAKTELKDDGFAIFFDKALDSILADIRQDLSEFGVDYDTWYSERSLFSSDKITAALEKLKASGHLYEKGTGDDDNASKQKAWWFRSTEFGDQKDRVVVRDNGQPTYFASDIAYHQDKLDRGFDQCINIWGSDHHGYIPRVKAAMQAIGLDEGKLTVLLVQFAVLYRGGEKVSMSTRSGEFVTLRELRDEVGADAARFFYVQRKSEQHMDFDLDLAKSQSNENPVYYVQYAHARICSIFTQARERNLDVDGLAQADFSLLSGEHESALLKLLERFPEVVQTAARDYEPHLLTYYLRDLATAFHSYYNSTKFLDAPSQTRGAMLALCSAVRQVLLNGLNIVGVNAPEKM